MIPLPRKANNLVAWLISGDRTKVQESQRKLLLSYWHHGEVQPQNITIPHGECGNDGAYNLAPIRFLPL